MHVTIQIRGVRSPQTLFEVEQLVGARYYQQGTDPDYYMDFWRRLEASEAVMRLMTLHGVTAKIIGDPEAEDM